MSVSRGRARRPPRPALRGSAPPPTESWNGVPSMQKLVWSTRAEINIKPWDALRKDLDAGNRKVKWVNREPYAYWKGNPDVAATRQELVKYNVSSKQEWNARIYKQDWVKESKAGYKQSDLASQCTHSYKIYIEGSAWSVSEKYILACDSMMLVITPKYYDFFSRVLMPTQHYWPVRDDSKCSSIKYVVDWGNSHKINR